MKLQSPQKEKRLTPKIKKFNANKPVACRGGGGANSASGCQFFPDNSPFGITLPFFLTLAAAQKIFDKIGSL